MSDNILRHLPACLLAAVAPFAIVACAGHPHWVKDGVSHDASHQELVRCEATAGGSAVKVEECMEEKGFRVDHQHLSPRPEQRPALEAIPRLPTY